MNVRVPNNILYFMGIVGILLLLGAILSKKDGPRPDENAHAQVHVDASAFPEGHQTPSGLSQMYPTESYRMDEYVAEPKGMYGDPTLPPDDYTGTRDPPNSPKKLLKYAQQMANIQEPRTADFGATSANSHQTIQTAYVDRKGIRDMHPVLAYQYMHDKAINPANIGDPIRIPDVAGGGRNAGLYGDTVNFMDSLSVSRGSIPVPMGALKMTNEQYNKDMFRFSPLASGTIAQPTSGGALGGTSGGALGGPVFYGGPGPMGIFSFISYTICSE